MLTELSSLVKFYKFFLNVFSAPESHPGYHLALPLYLPGLLWSMTVSQTFPVIEDIKFWKSTSHSFCRNSVWFCSMFSLVLTGVMGLGEKDCRSRLPFSSFMSRGYAVNMTVTDDVSLDHWRRSFLPGLSAIKLPPLLSPFQTLLFGSKSLSAVGVEWERWLRKEKMKRS